MKKILNFWKIEPESVIGYGILNITTAKCPKAVETNYADLKNWLNEGRKIPCTISLQHSSIILTADLKIVKKAKTQFSRFSCPDFGCLKQDLLDDQFVNSVASRRVCEKAGENQTISAQKIIIDGNVVIDDRILGPLPDQWINFRLMAAGRYKHLSF